MSVISFKDIFLSVKLGILCAACFFYALVRKNAKNPPRAPRRIMVVQMAKLGDMVCTTPMFRAIKRSYHSSSIAVLGNALNKKVLEYNKDVDSYLTFSGIWRTIMAVRKGSYDFGCIATPDFVSLAALFLGGVQFIVVPEIKNGFSPYETVSYRLARRLVLRKPHHMGSYAPREYLRLLEPIGIYTDDTINHLGCSDEARARAKALFENYKKEGKTIIGFSPSAGNKIKTWGGKKFAAVANTLAREFITVTVIFGGARDRAEVNDMRDGLNKDAATLDLSEKLSIDELKAAISELDLFVAVDTGPVYIAEAFGVPTVDITGPIDEREQPPRGEKHVVVAPPGNRTPQLFVMNARVYDEKEVRRQTDSISVDMVTDACRKLLMLLLKKH